MRIALLLLSMLFITSESIAQTTLVKVVIIVEDFEAHKGMAGALVTVRQTASTQPTLADGKVTFNNVPVGEIEYYIMKEGYQFETGRVNVSTDEKTNIFRIPISKIDDRKILVTGEVTDSEGRDLKDALVEVKIADQVRTVMTDASGNYSVDIAPSTKFPTSSMRIEVKKGDCKKTETVDIPRTNVVYKDFKLDCTTENTSNPEKSTKTPPLKSVLGKAQKYNILYELLECKQTGNEIICSLRITSLGKDDKISIYGLSNGGTIIWDAQTGSEYYSNAVKIGDKIGEAHTQKNLVADFPVLATITFGEVNDTISTISKLTINGGSQIVNQNFSVELRNITVKH